MKRSEFMTLLAGATAWPLAARAQLPAVPVIGFLRSTPAAPFTHLVTAFRQGLTEAGFVEGRNVTIEYRYADSQLDRLPGLAAELVRRQVAVIVANSTAAEVAKALTATIPIVFVAGNDPVKQGLVASLGRPGGNLTGITFFSGELGAKRLQLLHELVPKAAIIAVLTDPSAPGAMDELADAEAAGRALGRELVVVRAESESELEPAFERIVQAGAGALMVSGARLFTTQRRALVALAARHAIPAIYDVREHVEAGGLISYAGSLADAHRQAGVYAAKILKGAKPSELPVLQPTIFELVINLKTAKTLGLTVPPTLLLIADEVIE